MFKGLGSLLPTALLLLLMGTCCSVSLAQPAARELAGWKLEDVAKVTAGAAEVSTSRFDPDGWYAATVPGTVLTTLVDNKVYPDPLYGENMRAIPESLNKTSYWYRTTFVTPAFKKAEHVWLHFGGVNYSADVWVNGQKAGTMRGAFVRGDFEISALVKPGHTAVVAVLVAPQPHPGVPHEHTVALGEGSNGGETAIDGPTFLSTIGWDWLPAVRDRDTGLWLPVTVSTTGPVVVKDPYVTSKLDAPLRTADLTVETKLENLAQTPVTGTLIGTISGPDAPVTFRRPVTIGAGATLPIRLDPASATPELHLDSPKLWWPNGYGPQNLYTLRLQFVVGGQSSATETTTFGIRKIEYQVADSENLTISVNNVKVMARGGDWGLDDAMKRLSPKRLDAQFHMHALANLNFVRNWVGQSTSPLFYEMADKYGLLIWDEFFQPNPSDGPDPTDIPTYLRNVTDKVERYRNHPSIAVWCARNEGYPPAELDQTLKVLMTRLDPSRLYQSNSADGRGVKSGGPYYWRSPRFFYVYQESFKTETGSISIPTIESIQGMMPEKDWETINDDWAQHDMAAGAERGDQFPADLAKRYGPIRNLADFVRKGELATYEAYRAMYEGRNAGMFKTSTGVLTWMSHPAQPSFVWQLYHYDLEPNAALYAAKKAAERVHVQLNELEDRVEVVNNTPEVLQNLTVRTTVFNAQSAIDHVQTDAVAIAPASATTRVVVPYINSRISEVYFVKLDLNDSSGHLLSTNFYWRNVAQDDFTSLSNLPRASLAATATSVTDAKTTKLTLRLTNPTGTIALMTHVQLHRRASGKRVLPVFYSDNYLSLVPGETRTITVETATEDLGGEAPLLLVDGFNVGIVASEGAVSIRLNENAQPMHWPQTKLVPAPDRS